jgi:hypothetical protein
MGKRINSVEILILLGVTYGFGFSAYRLFRETPKFTSELRSNLNRHSLLDKNREPASTSSTFGHIESACTSLKKVTVKFSKIRVSGPICGLKGSKEQETIQSATVINSANQFQATVFTDPGQGKFSTDYIPLNADQNIIEIKFKFKSGKNSAQKLSLKKE